MATRAIQFLKSQNVDFDVVKYDHRIKGAEFAAKAIGFPLEKVVKTLVVQAGTGSHGLALVPGDRQLSLKRVAKAFSAKRAVMADVEAAERLTGYTVGGISPFGIKRKLPAVIEKNLIIHDTVAINAGRRGILLFMAPEDIVRVLGCLVSEIVEQE